MASTGAPVSGLRFNDLRRGSVELSGTRFHIRGMRPGSLKLVASGEHVESYPFPKIDLPAGTQVDLGAVELRGVTSLSVRVVDAGDNLRRKARVWLQRLPVEDGGRPVGSKKLKLDFNARNQAHQLRKVPRYRWMLHAQQDGMRSYKKPVMIHGRTQTVVVRMTAKRKRR